MTVLSQDQRVRVIAALVEGNSVRSTERLVGVHRDTILKLLVRVGDGCAALHDRLVRGLRCASIELDEIWAFVKKKQAQRKDGDPDEYGDAYTFVALDAVSRLVICWRCDKRTFETAVAFVEDIRVRVLNRPQITSDGFAPYIEAIEQAFGCDVDYAQVIKIYAKEQEEGEHRYSSANRLKGMKRRVISGDPERAWMTTNHMERGNLHTRMAVRRFTRLTNAFSKKLRNLQAAVALHFVHYNFCWVHETLRCTPAMQAGLTDHIWGIDELLALALNEPLCGPRLRVRVPAEFAPSPVRVRVAL